jgi:hypothetical protein
MDSQRSKE